MIVASKAVEAFGCDHPARDVIRAQQLSGCGSEHAKAEPRQFIPTEVAVAAIDALRADRLWINICRKNPEHAVDMRQVGPVLVKLALQLSIMPASSRRFSIRPETT
jgi:hypothetical protein